MFDFLFQYKWHALLAFESFSYVFTFLAAVSYYWWNSKKLTWFFGSLDFLIGWLPHILLVVIDIIKTKEVGIFTYVVIAIGIYLLTFGKKHVLRINEAIKNWVMKKRQNLEAKKKQKEDALKQKKAI